MRSFRNGTLRTDETGLFPPRNRERAPLFNSPSAHHGRMASPERMFLLGDPRSNQNPVSLAFGILFFRWHNVLAERIQMQNPDWTDEEIFQRARRLVIASIQNIILYEYLPTLLDEQVTSYGGYQPDVHPGVSHVFQSAAFRFGHTMIPPGLYRRDANCRFRPTGRGHPGVSSLILILIELNCDNYFISWLLNGCEINGHDFNCLGASLFYMVGSRRGAAWGGLGRAADGTQLTDSGAWRFRPLFRCSRWVSIQLAITTQCDQSVVLALCDKLIAL